MRIASLATVAATVLVAAAAASVTARAAFDPGLVGICGTSERSGMRSL